MKQNPKVVSFDRSPAYVHHRAMVNRRENNAVDALELLRHAVERSPENREYRLDLAELYCEMGCHEQSNRLLLDMLAQDDAPAECYYGLALNQLGMNDLEGAQQSLRMYRHAAPDGAHAPEVRRLSDELDAFDALNRPASRKVYRAMRVADRACEALRGGDLAGARRMFERSLSLSPEQYEMRALYAMTRLLEGDSDDALEEASRAAEGFPPSARALCIASQVFWSLEREEDARKLLRRAIELRPDGADQHLLLYSLSEAQMDAEAAECARLALQEAPFDRRLLHIRATALHRTGAADDQVGRFWRRILRIDPDDEVARFYLAACERGELGLNEPEYAYQLPRKEHERRQEWISGLANGGLAGVRAEWVENPEFRRAVRWAATADDGPLSRMAVLIIAALDDDEARSAIRLMLFDREVDPELRVHVTALMRLRGVDMAKVFPVDAGAAQSMMPDADALMAGMTVGERQLLRYANDVLEQDYDISALPVLALTWAIYRQRRGGNAEPLVQSDTVSAALVYRYLTTHGRHARIGRVAKRFGCSVRRLKYYVNRIAGVFARLEGETKDENL